MIHLFSTLVSFFLSATVLLCRRWLLNDFLPRSGAQICTLTNVCDPNSAYINLFGGPGELKMDIESGISFCLTQRIDRPR